MKKNTKKSFAKASGKPAVKPDAKAALDRFSALLESGEINRVFAESQEAYDREIQKLRDCEKIDPEILRIPMTDFSRLRGI